jgi:hypothetical protein
MELQVESHPGVAGRVGSIINAENRAVVDVAGDSATNSGRFYGVTVVYYECRSGI